MKKKVDKTEEANGVTRAVLKKHEVFNRFAIVGIECKSFVFIKIKTLGENMKWILLIISFIIFQCSSLFDSEAENQYIRLTLSGENVNEKLFIEDNSTVQGVVYFNVQDDVYGSPINGGDSLGYTQAGLFDFSGSTPFHLSVSFPGKKTGTYEWLARGFEGRITIQRTSDIYSEFKNLQGHIQVDKYGDIGERVKGSIFGTVVELSSNDTLQVTGEFSLIRKNDFTGLLQNTLNAGVMHGPKSIPYAGLPVLKI